MNEFINFRSFIIPKEYEVEFFDNVLTLYFYLPITFLIFLFFSEADYGKLIYQLTFFLLLVPLLT